MYGSSSFNENQREEHEVEPVYTLSLLFLPLKVKMGKQEESFYSRMQTSYLWDQMEHQHKAGRRYGMTSLPGPAEPLLTAHLRL